MDGAGAGIGAFDDGQRRDRRAKRQLDAVQLYGRRMYETMAVWETAMIAANLVDDFHVFVNPIILGCGNPWLPPDVRMALELVDERLGVVVHLH